MRINACLGIVAVAGAFAFSALAARAQDSSQTADPVVEAARKSRDEKKAAVKPKKVYTEDDIPARKAGDTVDLANSQSASPNATPAPDASAATTGPTASTGATLDKDEQMWKKKFADAHAKLAGLEKELDVLQREEEKSQLQYYPDPQKAMTEQNTRKDISDKNAKIAAKKQEIAAMKQTISDMEDELRKSGGDPGWAR